MAYYPSGRRIVYTNQVPFETDILATNNYNMAASSALAQTILGFGISEATTVRGLACTPISPPGMSVVVGPGVMYSLEDYDATDYGVIPADTSANHMLYKQAFNWNPVTLPVVAPATPGDSVIYLIEGIFVTEDVNNVSRPYFNSADPTMPIFNNNYDTRTDVVHLVAKQGVAGISPTPPTPDAGYTGLYYVTVANGQTTIISGNIAKVSTVEGQPFITEGLTQKVSSSTVASGFVSIANQQKSTYVYGNDVGSVNAIVVNPANPYPAYVGGTTIDVLIANDNTGPATLNVSGNGNLAIRVGTSSGLAALAGNELKAGCIATFKCNGSTAQLMTPANDLTSTIQYSQVAFGATTNQTISGDTSSAPVKVNLNNTLYDPNSWWDGTLHRYVPTLAGRYRINWIGHAVAEAGTFYTAVYKNGALARRVGETGSGNGASTVGGSFIILMNGSTDYLEPFAAGTGTFTIGYDGSAGSGDKTCLFEIEYLGL